MGFPEDLSRHAEQIVTRTPHIRGEEATKHALVVPLIQLLGYDVFDPREVQPEYTADFATKTRGQLEKIDYAIWKDGKAAIFVECKATTAELADHDGQLSRYFNATPSVRVGVLTNGIRLKAFTDLEQPNVMDPKPFLDVDLTALKAAEIDALRRFHKVDFSTEQIISLAEEMVYYSALTKMLAVQLREPSDSFLRFVMSETPVFGRATSRVVERVRPILKKAIQATILESVARSFESADGAAPVVIARPEASSGTSAVPVQASRMPLPPGAAAAPSPAIAEKQASGAGEVVTTAEELACWAWVEKLIHERHPGAPLAFRDSLSYFTVHQANLRKWFLRINVQKAPSLRSLARSPDMHVAGVPRIRSSTDAIARG
jgi:predicted type IV restriction endonuclease